MIQYAINGVSFEDNNIRVSKSSNILGKLKPKQRTSYNWAEYHGTQVDTSKTYYESRELSLDCWIEGENWIDMVSKFNTVAKEFDKSGLQQLVIDVFGQKSLVYNVYLSDEASINKTFRKGNMVATFQMKMTEPNPIKIVVSTEEESADISFNSEKIVNVNGIMASGNFSQSVKSGMPIKTANLLRNSSFAKGIEGWNIAGDVEIEFLKNEARMYSKSGGGFWRYVDLNGYNGDMTVSFEMKPLFMTGFDFVFGVEAYSVAGIQLNNDNSKWTRFSHTFNTQDKKGFVLIFYFQGGGEKNMLFRNVQLEKGNIVTDWGIANKRFITVSGDVDEIKNFKTNGYIEWEKL